MNHQKNVVEPLPNAEATGEVANGVAWRYQRGVGAAVLLLALWMGWGVWRIPSAGSAEAAWVPGLCALALAVCGIGLMAEAQRGGWRHVSSAGGQASMQLGPGLWIAAGLLVNVLLMPHVGFVLASMLCYVLAVQGLRRAAQSAAPAHVRVWLQDGAMGLGWSMLVWLLFTQILNVALPALLISGWL